MRWPRALTVWSKASAVWPRVTALFIAEALGEWAEGDCVVHKALSCDQPSASKCGEVIALFLALALGQSVKGFGISANGNCFVHKALVDGLAEDLGFSSNTVIPYHDMHGLYHNIKCPRMSSPTEEELEMPYMVNFWDPFKLVGKRKKVAMYKFLRDRKSKWTMGKIERINKEVYQLFVSSGCWLKNEVVDRDPHVDEDMKQHEHTINWVAKVDIHF
ncbi:hypothetical protein FNV43_RR00763 [Rhamnella rubrinervis]|uniref:Uncharacterized protein n=1 Tax=Rhamnella rubrinervis TaxID=2594499 RepID=A0A8K0HP87_9ROSA|nr:hypothetical protein FNV43_RR00763 [Rhamnella rubrinervis]